MITKLHRTEIMEILLLWLILILIQVNFLITKKISYLIIFGSGAREIGDNGLFTF